MDIDIQKIIRVQNELIKAQKEYIEFLGNDYNRVMGLSVTHHNIKPPLEVIENGIKLRENLKNLETQLNEL